MSRVWIAVLAFVVYAPALFGGYVYDDERFIGRNPPVTDPSVGTIAAYFSDASTHGVIGHDIYRPLRTIDFAIDWAIGRGHPWFFHFHSMLWHVAACLALFAVLRILLKSERAALFGALAFALHPVHTESVAWITSRGDVMVAALFLLAVLFWLKEKPIAAVALFVGALFSKESAVMFPAAILLVDWYRGAPRRWLWYGVFGCLSLFFTALWMSLVGKMGQLNGEHWGGSYAMTLLTVAKGMSHYARVIALPVHFTIDYYVPPSSGLGWAEVKAILILALLGASAWLGGRRSRFAIAWFAIAILPVSNVLVPIAIPTAERFLYLPVAGLALLVGPFFERHSRVAVAILAIMFALTLQRSTIWRDDLTLWRAAEKVTPTPRSLDYLAAHELALAHDLLNGMSARPPEQHLSIRTEARTHAAATVRHIDDAFWLCNDVIRMRIPTQLKQNYSRKANALVILGRPEEGLRVAEIAIKEWGEPMAYFNAALACQALERWLDAAVFLQDAQEKGYEKGDLSPAIAGNWLRAGAKHEQAGNRESALRCYRRSWKALPDSTSNAAARAALKRLGG
jgi:tetratricopeptide (TPR) repeat protein